MEAMNKLDVIELTGTGGADSVTGYVRCRRHVVRDSNLATRRSNVCMKDDSVKSSRTNFYGISVVAASTRVGQPRNPSPNPSPSPRFKLVRSSH